MIKRLSVGIIFCMTLQLTGYAQKRHKIDSLKTELKNAIDDTLQVTLLFTLSMNYQGFQPDSAMAFAQASLKKSVEMNYTKGQADAMLHIGRLKRDLGHADNALQEMFKALELYRKDNDQIQIANSLNDISIIYAQSGDLEKSLEYFQQALEIFQQTGNEKGESYALNNIGRIYQDLGDEKKAKEYFLESLAIKEKNQDLYGISRGYVNIGSIAERNSQWNEALSFYLKADSILKKIHDRQAQASNFVAIARIKKQQQKNTEAMHYATLGLETAREIKSLSTMLDASKLLAEREELRGNYQASLEYQKLYNLVADSLQNESHRAILEELKAKFNFEEKEREIKLLKKDQELQHAVMARTNIITYGMFVGMLALIIISLLIYYAYRTTKTARDNLAVKNGEIEKQKEDLDKMNKEKDRFFSILSHDLRAPLTSMKGLSHLITNHRDAFTPEELTDMHKRIDTSMDNMTELINNILEWSVTSMQNRKWKFEKIDTSALIQKNISLYKTIAESKDVRLINTSQEKIFGNADLHAIDTVIRNLLSNSIKFSYPGKDVIISTTMKENHVTISVKDSGVGISAEIKDKLFFMDGLVSQPGTNNEKGIGIGLALCRDLMKENNGDITVKSKPEEGSEFIISFPASKPE